jgi:hypothetical protein
LAIPFVTASAQTTTEDRPFAVFGVGAGAMQVDVADPEHPGDTFGTRFRGRFDLGVRPLEWLEVGGEVGLTRCGASDSVNAILESQGDDPDAAYTLVDWNVGARFLLPGTQRLVPWVRAALGQAWLRLSAPDGYRVEDLAWVAGVGLDTEPWRSVLFRAEARYLGIDTSPDVSHNVSVDLALYYAFHRSQFD